MSHPPPEPLTDELARFRVEGPLAVKAVMTEMLRHNAEIRLFNAGDYQQSVVSRLLRVSNQGLHLDFKTSVAERRKFEAAGVVAVAFMGSVKVQFACSELESGGAGDSDDLLCPLPEAVYRIQRREAFRVSPPIRRPVECIVRPTQGAEIRYRVHDVSVSGVALISSGALAPVVEGEIWRNCRLEIPGYSPIAFDLLIRSVKPDAPDKPNAKRIGCEFHRPSSESQRAIQVYVMDIERTQRSRGPALARP